MLKKAVIMRSGTMEYLESDLLPNGASNKIVTVFRSDEVLQKYHSTFVNTKLVDRHYIKNTEDFRVLGTVVDTLYKDGKIEALIDMDILPITTIQLSGGYYSELVKKSDTEYELVSFRGEHVAIVDNGRCGEICKIF